MTTDEKTKAYEMALEGARKELGVDRKEWEVVQQVLHNIFPQLCESEDERIRKEICNFLIDMECKKEWIAYMEKQKVEDVSASTMIPSCWAEEPSLQKEQKSLINKINENIRERLIEYFQSFLEGYEDCYKVGGHVKMGRFGCKGYPCLP